MSSRIQTVLTMFEMAGTRPSEIIGLDNEYEAFCFDEACIELLIRLKNGEKPKWIDKKNAVKKRNNNEFINFIMNQ